jgi:hypothetical protein
MRYQVGQKKQAEKIGFNTNKKISNYVGTHLGPPLYQNWSKAEPQNKIK